MFQPNEAKVLAEIGPDDVVLDVGGWARSFNRANYVLDLHPYETRGRHYRESAGLEAQGGPNECFTAETYIRRDVCAREPWPFADKSIDYCVCSHTLEDLRDPIWVCDEMVRVAKRGYVETPSHVFEASRNREPGVPVGLSHHRWIVEIEGTHITFYPKRHDIHGDPRLSLPESYWSSLPEEKMVAWLFWEGGFTYEEGWFTKHELEDFALRHVGTAQDPPETEQLRFKIWEARQELEGVWAHHEDEKNRLAAEADRLLFAIWEARREHEATQAELSSTTERLIPFEALAPEVLRIAERLHVLTRRHPRLSRALMYALDRSA